jgi:hypothetical protein
MALQRRHFGLVSVIICIAVLAPLFLYSPSYLEYGDMPAPSDCVVLLIGPEYTSRQDRAREILGKGYSSCLIIPAMGKLATGLSSIERLTSESEHGGAPSIEKLCSQRQFRYMERTHLEILLAKQSMDRHAMKSVTFVSSPYHMRRVRVIADSVFDHDKYLAVFVPGNHENEPSAWWMFSGSDLRWVSSEYVKIAWFLIYDGMNLFPDTLADQMESTFTWRPSDPIS